MKNPVKQLICILMAAAALALHSPASAAIAVVAQPGVADEVKAKVAKTVSQFNDILAREMKVRLTRDITIHLCPDNESYRRTLETTIGMTPALAASTAKVSSGLSNSSHQAIAVKFDPESAADFDNRATTVVAHELFHQVQYQLSGNHTETAQKWLREGTADLVGALIAERIGYQSLDKWRADRINAIRRAKATVKPADILHVELAKWNRYIEDGLLPYQVSDLMVFFLLTKVGNNLEPIATYFTLAGTSRDDDLNFRQAFGLSPGEFLPAFEKWLAGMLAEPATIEVLTEGDGVDPAKIRRAAAASQQYFQNNFATAIRSNIRIVAAAGRPAYAAALARQFGLDAAEAERRAQSSTWSFAGSTLVANTAGSNSDGELALLVATSLTRRLAQEAASLNLLESVYWLYYGSTEIISLQIAENLGYPTRQNLGRWRTDILSHSRPTLGEITGKQGWEQAIAKHGRATVQKTARLAALYLAEKHGEQALYRWYVLTNETQDARKAFTSVFGLAPEALEADFAGYLQSRRVGITAYSSLSFATAGLIIALIIGYRLWQRQRRRFIAPLPLHGGDGQDQPGGQQAVNREQ